MRVRNLADPDYEPSDEDLRELLAGAGADARERHARAESLQRERTRAERIRLGLVPIVEPKIT